MDKCLAYCVWILHNWSTTFVDPKVIPGSGQLCKLYPSGCTAGKPLIADGYVLPLPNQQLMTGASYDFDDSDPMLRRDSQIENLRRLHTLLPQSDAIYAHTADTLPLAGRTGFRCVTSDRMPMIGQFANEAQALARAGELSGAHFADLPRQDGLYCAFAYGSRGLVWASLAAEILVSQIEGEPLPIDRKLADGVDPARFLLRFLRQAPGT